ncbi:DUF2007 domain-containing protein [Aliagarivorans marinus]|uniref:putative signal transducing protein n=1 Tax=Aliagarivorans marinus TaxID=561965 RepID=UPI00041A406D|nr:DUF2007 domain-containing protein [Aliagarivorans marinus]
MNYRSIYNAANMLEANLLKGLLETHGIAVLLKGDGLVAAVGELPTSALEVSLWVKAFQQDYAKELLNDYEQSSEREWRCPSCDEINTDAFEHCWQCQHPRSSC